MSQTVRVTQSYAAFYDDPIQVCAGSKIELTGRVDVWDGHTWLWAIAEDGRAGWVPDSLADNVQQGVRRAKSDYSAFELSCTLGELLTRQHSTHGWTWCTNAQGHQGWVPDRERHGRPSD